jgi:hypothetical protein
MEDNDDEDDMHTSSGIPSQIEIMRARAKREQLRNRPSSALEQELDSCMSHPSTSRSTRFDLNDDDFIPLDTSSTTTTTTTTTARRTINSTSSKDRGIESTLVREDEFDKEEEHDFDDPNNDLLAFASTATSSIAASTRKRSIFVVDDRDDDDDDDDQDNGGGNDQMLDVAYSSVVRSPTHHHDSRQHAAKTTMSLDEIKRKMQHSIASLRQRQNSHLHRLQEVAGSLHEKTQSLEKLEQARAQSANEHVFFQEMRDYLRNLLACISEKVCVRDGEMGVCQRWVL